MTQEELENQVVGGKLGLIPIVGDCAEARVTKEQYRIMGSDSAFMCYDKYSIPGIKDGYLLKGEVGYYKGYRITVSD